MDCLILPVSILTRRCSGYRQLSGDVFGGSDDPVTVVVGKERREFVVDPFVLDENPFRALIEMLKKDKKGRVEIQSNKRMVFVDVDAILFEHLLWLMHNDWASLLQLNMREIVDFYAQDI